MRKLIKDLFFGATSYFVAVVILSSCETTREVENYPTLNIYQPPILVLPAGKSIQTKEGIYTPQKEETWHSDKRFRELEREIY